MIEVLIHNEHHGRKLVVQIFESLGDKDVIYSQKEGQIIQETVDKLEMPTVAPMLTLPDYLAKPFIKQIVEYASKQGICAENENLLKGKLNATEKHLMDLQEIVRKVLPIALEK